MRIISCFVCQVCDNLVHVGYPMMVSGGYVVRAARGKKSRIPLRWRRMGALF